MAFMNITTSLLIATYNWPEALELSLLSAFNQSVLPNKIIIADDGSTVETKILINQLRKKSPVPLLHVWHEDNGFRKTIILNEAIKRCESDYIIQIDGDIVLDNFFIEDHLYFARKGFYIRGSRTLLNEEDTNKLITNKLVNINAFNASNKNRISCFRSRLLAKIFVRLNNPRSIEGVKGCNMSFWKNDCITTNGYNNDITGWGREDSEFAARLINAGFLKRHVKFCAVCYHLHHHFFARDNDSKNLLLLQKTMYHKVKSCVNGININSDVEVW
jgi:glycosyltransferase involved in cell wall biosynthesis